MVYIYIFICTTRPKVPPLGSLLKVAQDPYWCKPEWEQTGEGIINLVYFFLIQIFILHSLNPTAPHTSDLISSAQLEGDNYIDQPFQKDVVFTIEFIYGKIET